ncbi:HD-GYP domain-containing protein [Heliophilum fasciatum]|nr:HD domain-containing phosphohydrolase [Heliophilum fasciatum]MCW2277589.1 HD-GYP domain-containing protein (c-di-GMP phosphodiesterase class II) [Heliophilum fasciatum]
MSHFISTEITHFLSALSTALDFTAEGLTRHHRRATYIAVQIGKHLGLSDRDMLILFCAASVHDIGAITFQDKQPLSQLEMVTPHLHCTEGYHLLKTVPAFASIAEVILHHHDFWQSDTADYALTPTSASASASAPASASLPDTSLPFLGHIIHLADRFEVALVGKPLLIQRNSILEHIDNYFHGALHPDIRSALYEAAKPENFWLDLSSIFLEEATLAALKQGNTVIQFDNEDLRGVARLFGELIDRKSRFTLRHSRLVSASAKRLAELAGWTPSQTMKMEIASLLHDLGKLSIPESILEKPGALTRDEYSIMKQHTYYTYHLLHKIPGFADIAEWAAYHHERVDGSGYPFRIPGAKLCQGSRIVAVADIFSALIEDRPYRPGMPKDRICSILRDSVHSGAIDADLVGLLLENYSDFYEIKNTLS